MVRACLSTCKINATTRSYVLSSTFTEALHCPHGKVRGVITTDRSSRCNLTSGFITHFLLFACSPVSIISWQRAASGQRLPLSSTKIVVVRAAITTRTAAAADWQHRVNCVSSRGSRNRYDEPKWMAIKSYVCKSMACPTPKTTAQNCYTTRRSAPFGRNPQLTLTVIVAASV